MIKGDFRSNYQMNYGVVDEAKELLASQTKQHNYKADEFKVYANEYIKFKGNLRLL